MGSTPMEPSNHDDVARGIKGSTEMSGKENGVTELEKRGLFRFPTLA
jgi:hypothetical protein